MPAPAATNPSRPSQPPLADVARHLEAAVHAAGWGGPPLLMCLGDDPSHPDASSPLPPVEPVADDPVADLLGYVVPADCSGLAVVAEGSGRRLVDGDDAVADGDAPPTPYRLAYVLHRSGRAASVLRPHGGAPLVDEVADGERAGPQGRLVDVCHRALDLPTAPPPPTTAQLWALSWLDLLLARALGTPRPMTWAAVAGAHPAVALLEQAEGAPVDGTAVRPEILARLGVALGRAQPWDELRRATGAGEWSPHGLAADHAAWMDAGMYARWVTGEFLPVPVYLDELAVVLPGPVMAGVGAVVAAATAADHPIDRADTNGE